MTPAQPAAGLAARILDALPQTQCQRCGYADCAAYAQAIAHGTASINQCPPGGQSGIERLSAICGPPAQALNPAFGVEGPRHLAVIDEAWCIGCTLCIEACPTDAILGANKRMHTVIEPHCTGCALCVPVCPVDCIQMEPINPEATGWAAWSQASADQARARYAFRQQRLLKCDQAQAQRNAARADAKLADLAAHSRISDTEQLERKRRIIEDALASARQKRAASNPN